MRTIKLVVIGASGVGKTSLRNQVRLPTIVQLGLLNRPLQLGLLAL